MWVVNTIKPMLIDKVVRNNKNKEKSKYIKKLEDSFVKIGPNLSKEMQRMSSIESDKEWRFYFLEKKKKIGNRKLNDPSFNELRQDEQPNLSRKEYYLCLQKRLFDLQSFYMQVLTLADVDNELRDYLERKGIAL